MTNFQLMLYEHLMFYYSILIFSPIIQTILPSLSLSLFNKYKVRFIKSIFKYLNELNTCSKSSKLLCLPFLAFFPLLYFFLSIEWKTHIMASVYLKAIIKLQNFSAGGHEGWFLIEKVFLINFVFQWKKSIPHLLNGMKVNLATRKVL